MLYILRPGMLTLEDLKLLMVKPYKKVELDSSCWHGIDESVRTIEEILASGQVVYGINTGFGRLAQSHIDKDNLQELQKRLVLSHAAGTGNLLDDTIVRLILIIKINSLARGYSGVRAHVIKMLLRLLNEDAYPCIPSKGSVGASGDLAPLAHLSTALLGVGQISLKGKILPASEVLSLLKLAPIELAAKEGLALLNGSQASTALAVFSLLQSDICFKSALTIGALSVDAAAGSDAPFDARIHAVRNQTGQIEVASILRYLLKDSKIRQSHINCERVQDPYSLRCQPQVMGACFDHLKHAAYIIEREVNAVSDNPLIFADDDQVLSGGNFHAEPVALAADAMAVAVSEIGALSERRIALLIDSSISGLPPFLVEEPGLNSGFMIAHVTAAALASENKSLAHPASVDSLPTSANQEDHVSMATFAARRLIEMADNVKTILAIELLAAVQGIGFRAPHKTSPILENIVQLVRGQVAPWKEDRYMAPDIAYGKRLIDEELVAHPVKLTLLNSKLG
ncbi:MAG: histidine ammonia-lyase [Alphaproteobacteria bacterium]|nr:histidine ammonia-lyase [Alphaproteobacteria bacterium]